MYRVNNRKALLLPSVNDNYDLWQVPNLGLDKHHVHDKYVPNTGRWARTGAGTQGGQGTRATVPVPSPAKGLRGNHKESWIKCWTLQHCSLMKREKGKGWMNIHLRTPAKCWKWPNSFKNKSAFPLRAVLFCLLHCQGHSGELTTAWWSWAHISESS